MPGTTKTDVSLGPYAWHYKNQRFLGPRCLALQNPTFLWAPKLGTTKTGVSLGPYAWHYKNRRFLGPLCLALQKPTFPWAPMPGTAKTEVSLDPPCLALQKPTFPWAPMPGTTKIYVSLGPYSDMQSFFVFTFFVRPPVSYGTSLFMVLCRQGVIIMCYIIV